VETAKSYSLGLSNDVAKWKQEATKWQAKSMMKATAAETMEQLLTEGGAKGNKGSSDGTGSVKKYVHEDFSEAFLRASFLMTIPTLNLAS